MSDPTQPNSSDPVLVEEVFTRTRSEVWDAITNRDHMVNWFFEEISEFKPESGFETSFNISTDERDFLHLWRITEVIPEKKIVYDWRYQDCPGVGKVIFELFDDPAGCRLRVTNFGLETFPTEVPEFTRESCQQGWEYFLKESLKSYLSSE
jgi:uncharacterized protein YndB with AHSA1/START domain